MASLPGGVRIAECSGGDVLHNIYKYRWRIRTNVTCAHERELQAHNANMFAAYLLHASANTHTFAHAQVISLSLFFSRRRRRMHCLIYASAGDVYNMYLCVCQYVNSESKWCQTFRTRNRCSFVTHTHSHSHSTPMASIVSTTRATKNIITEAFERTANSTASVHFVWDSKNFDQKFA